MGRLSANKALVPLVAVAWLYAVPAAAAAPAYGEAPAAVVDGVVSPAWIERAGTRQPIFAGMVLQEQDRIETGANARVLLTLPDDTQRYPIAGRVAWVTPPRAAGNRAQGVGIQFPSDEKSKQLKFKIEEILGAHLASERPTQTI